jgi:aryl-alcohol dehydrogenase-like predicted oxidoreductase
LRYRKEFHKISELFTSKIFEYMKNHSESRRRFITTSAAAAAGVVLMPGYGFTANRVTKPMKRAFGKLDFDVTTLGLGGQASIQWTPEDVDPVKIILKAFSKEINYFDTSNLYGPSQLNYGKAFKELNLLPAVAGYNESLRRSIFLTTKTHLRHAKGGDNTPGVTSRTNGNAGSHTVDDIKRSLSLMFGDGQGNYPAGAYLDMMLIHNLNTIEEVDALYEGYINTDARADRIGALAALRDFRDGSNLTGLNPKEEKLIRHIGFSGHYSPQVMIDMIQRDSENLLDAMLVSVNANDKLNFNMQHNVIPVAAAKNMGIIGMKVFADGAMYTKEAHWTRGPEEVVRTVGSPALPSRSLIEYTLTTPGVHTAIIGIGQISDNPALCQLEQNLSAAQVNASAMNANDRTLVENTARAIKEGKTNYFQLPDKGLTAPSKVEASQSREGDRRTVTIGWNTAFAGNKPLNNYEIWRDGRAIGTVRHQPQTAKTPFTYKDVLADNMAHGYTLLVNDTAGRVARSETIRVGEI